MISNVTNNNAFLTLNITTNKEFVKTGDEFNYVISVKNNGNLPAKDVVVTDNLPNCVTFIRKSFSGNGVNLGIDNNLIIYIGTIESNAIASINFNVSINGIKDLRQVHNSATVGYMYEINPNGTKEVAKSSSNLSIITVNEAIINSKINESFKLSIFPTFGDIGDTLTFTILLNNVGNVSAKNIILNTNLPDCFKIIKNSIFINNIQKTYEINSFDNKIYIDELPPSKSSIIIFKAEIIKIPQANLVKNISTIKYNYTLDPSLPNETSAFTSSNEVFIKINKAIIDFNNGNGFFNLIGKKHAKIGDEFCYTYTIGNTGNVVARDIVFTNTLPFELLYKEDSVFINNTKVENVNPEKGISLPSIIPNTSITLSFNVVINKVPLNNKIFNNGSIVFTYPKNSSEEIAKGFSETFVTEINMPVINSKDFKISCNNEYASIGDFLEYTILITNSGNIDAANLLLTNYLSDECIFVNDSLYINDRNVTDKSLNPSIGFALDTIKPNTTFKIKYKALVKEIPKDNFITNKGKVAFNYTFDPIHENSGFEESTSNLVKTKINCAIINSSDCFTLISTPYNKVGDSINYTFLIKNTGNVNANNVFIIDTLPKETSIIKGSLKINNISVNNSDLIEKNTIFLGTLKPISSSTVTFKVLVNSLPSSNKIDNVGFIYYDFYTDIQSKKFKSKTSVSNISTTKIECCTVSLNNSVNKLYANTNDELIYTYLIENTGTLDVYDIIFTTNFLSSINYTSNSLKYNDLFLEDKNFPLNKEINLGSLISGGVSTLTFSFKSIAIPKNDVIRNNGTINYKFKISPHSEEVREGTSISNEVETNIREAIIDYKNLSFSKYPLHSYLKFDETLTYINVIKNIGNIKATNVIFVDTLCAGLTFVKDSVKINEINKINENPIYGFNTGTIDVNSTYTIEYKVKINRKSNINSISSTSKVFFNYILDSSLCNEYKGKGSSNKSLAEIKEAIIDFDNGKGMFLTSYFDKYINEGKKITLEFNIANTGNVIANKVVFYNKLPEGLRFIPNSVYINSINIPNSNPFKGINLGSIPPFNPSNIELKVKFNVMVDTVPSLMPIYNKAKVKFTFTKNPNEIDKEIGFGYSNKVELSFNIATIDNTSGGGFLQSVNKQFTKTSSILTYNQKLKNTGNVSANNAVFINHLPEGTSFIKDSLKLNGVTLINENPTSSLQVNIGTLPPDLLNEIEFKVLVNTIPSNEIIQNSSKVLFSYIFDPSIPNGINCEGHSNIVQTNVKSAIIDNKGRFTLKSITLAGNKILYKCLMQNTGNVIANNLIFKFIIPEELSFEKDSLKINGKTFYKINPLTKEGIYLDSLKPKELLSIEFIVYLNLIPSINPIKALAKIQYTFLVDPESKEEEDFGISNVNEREIKLAIIDNRINNSLVKTVDKNIVRGNDIINYKVVLRNLGNVCAKDVIFKDMVPENTTLINDSISVNEIKKINVETIPYLKIPVGNIYPNYECLLTFSVIVNKLVLSPKILSQGRVEFNYDINKSITLKGYGECNAVESYYKEAIIDNSVEEGFKTSLSSSNAKVGDILTCTTILINKGNIKATNILYTDTLSKEIDFVKGSFKINTLTIPSLNPIYPSKVNLDSLEPNKMLSLSYKFVLSSLPYSKVIENSPNVIFDYKPDVSIEYYIKSQGFSNKSCANVIEAIIDNNHTNGIFKVDCFNNYTTINEEITYSFKIANTGNVIANNVVFTNTLPSSLQFVKGSLILNNKIIPSANPEYGVNIGDINPIFIDGEYFKISYKAKVISIPSNNVIKNKGFVNFKYIDNPKSNKYLSLIGYSEESSTNFNIAYISNENFKIYSDKDYLSIEDYINYKIHIKNTGNISANNTILLVTIPKEGSYVEDSLYVNNVKFNKEILNSNLKINLNTLDPNKLYIITFRLKIYNSQFNDYIFAKAEINFNYTFNPIHEKTAFCTLKSNEIKTKVNFAFIDKASEDTNNTSKYKKVGDVVTYNFKFRNTGNIIANKVIFKDPLCKDVSFKESSLVINGVSVPNINPTAKEGLFLGDINPGELIHLKFKVLINSCPKENKIKNTGLITFNYKVDSNFEVTKSVSSEYKSSSITINQGKINILNSIDKNFATTKDILTYTILVKNTGNIDVENIVLSTTFPKEITIIKESLYINEDPIFIEDFSLENGLNIHSLSFGCITTILFKAKIKCLPNNIISNIVSAAFEYFVSPEDKSTIIHDNSTSNEAFVTINEAIINHIDGGFIKYCKNQYIGFHDEINYITVLKNTGNVSAKSILFSESLPYGCKFISDSLFINKLNIPWQNIEYGVNLGSLSPNMTTTIEYKVMITTIPKVNSIKSFGNVNFKYSIDPEDPYTLYGIGQSNTVETTISEAILDYNNKNGHFLGKCNHEYVSLGKQLKYTYTLKNTGNTTANNIKFFANFPKELTFIENSFTLNNEIVKDSNPLNGINIGSIGVSTLEKNPINITFKAIAISIPNLNPIESFASVKFNYTKNPNNINDTISTGKSNIVYTNINSALISLNQDVSKNNIEYENELTYNFTFENNGNKTANNVIFKNTIPNGIILNTKLVLINNIPTTTSESSFINGISLGNISSNEKKTLSFSVTVTSICNINPIVNEGIIEFTYSVDSNNTIIVPEIALSNKVSTKIICKPKGNKEFTFKASKPFVFLGDSIEYSISIPNKGNIDINNVKLLTTIPEYCSIIKDSVVVDNKNLKLKDLSKDIIINIGDILENSTSTLSYKILIETIPSSNYLKAEALIKYNYLLDSCIKTERLELTKLASPLVPIIDSFIDFKNLESFKCISKPDYILIDDEISYILVLKNIGNIDATNICVKNPIPLGTEYLENSLYINNENISEFNSHKEIKLKINTLFKNQTTTITFKVLVTSIPKNYQIINKANIKYNLIVDKEKSIIIDKYGFSNTVYNYFSSAKIDTKYDGFKLYCDKSYGTIDDTLTYTFEIKNTGNINAENLILFSTIPKGTEFVEDSLLINGLKLLDSKLNPQEGINLNNLSSNEVSTITFKILLTNNILNSSNNEIYNSGTIIFDYNINKTNNIVSYGNSNIYPIKVIYDLVNKENFNIISDENYYKVNDIINYTINFKNEGNITLNNVVISSTIPRELTFIKDSLYINSKKAPNMNLEKGVEVPYLDKENTVSLNYSCKVISIPKTNKNATIAKVTYNYEADPTLNRIEEKSYTSNKNIITINSAYIDYNYDNGLMLSSDKDYVSEGDEITYTISLKNTGNTTAYYVILKNNIPNEIRYINNSLTINNLKSLNNNPKIINFNNVEANRLYTITFKAIVLTTPSPNNIKANSFVTFKYTLNPQNPNKEISNGYSNTKSIIINTAKFNDNYNKFTLINDKKVAAINDIITYNAILKNTGNVPANNVTFLSTLPNNIEFIKSSFKVNNIDYTLENSTSNISINLKNINPNEVLTLTYKAIVIKISSNNEAMSTYAKVKYTYNINPDDNNQRSNVEKSNTIYTNITSPFISNDDNGLVINADKPAITLNDVLTYTVCLKNTGNIKASEVIYHNTIPNSTVLISDSIYVNNIKSNDNAISKINIGTLYPNTISTITFKVKLKEYPNNKSLKNFGYVEYMYELEDDYKTNNRFTNYFKGVPTNNIFSNNKNLQPFEGDSLCRNISSTTNTVEVSVVNPKLDIKITSHKEIIDINDYVIYYVEITNTGNVLSENIIVENIIPTETVFIDNSLYINKVLSKDITSYNSFELKNLPIENSITYSFKIKANLIPPNNRLKYMLKTSYKFKVNSIVYESPTTINNFDLVSLNSVDLKVDYSCDKSFVTDEDTITYNVIIENLGNIETSNIVLKANISKEANFISESLIINSKDSNLNILNDINIANLKPKEKVLINFKAKVLNNIKTESIKSFISLSYSYQNSATNIVNCTRKSNEALSNYRSANILLEKSANKKVMELEETANITIKIKNTGNISANDITIKDILPKSLEFESGSLCINDCCNADLDITKGFLLKELKAHSEMKITYKATAIKVPFDNIAYSILSANYIYKLTKNHPIIIKEVKKAFDDIVIIAKISLNKVIENSNFRNTINYSIKGIAKKEDYLNIGSYIKNQCMWCKNEIFSEINIDSTKIKSIESLHGQIELIRTEVVDTPYTGNKTNLEGKKLTGKKMIINALIRYTLKYIDINFQIKSIMTYKLFGAYITVNPKYEFENLNVSSSLEDITISNFSNNIASIKSKVLFYLVPESCIIDIKEIKSSLNNLIFGISNNNLGNNLKEFIKPNNIYWDDFNIYVTDNVKIDFIQIISAKANISIFKSEVIPIKNTINNESTIKSLLVNMNININVNYIDKLNPNKIKTLTGRMPFSTSIILDSKIQLTDKFVCDTCIENLYVAIDKNNLFTNATITIKATKIY